MSEDQRIADSVEKHQWHAIGVDDATPPFLYTIGLCATLNHPDLIIFNLEREMAHRVCSALVKRIKNEGMSLRHLEVHPLIGDLSIQARQVHKDWHEIYFGFAMGFYRHIGDPFLLMAIQVLLPDDDGRFPDDVLCHPEIKASQPLLDLPPSRRELQSFRREYGT